MFPAKLKLILPLSNGARRIINTDTPDTMFSNIYLLGRDKIDTSISFITGAKGRCHYNKQAKY